jgi:hypothetical protein
MISVAVIESYAQCYLFFIMLSFFHYPVIPKDELNAAVRVKDLND